MNGESLDTWPAAGLRLIDELTSSRGRFALIDSSVLGAADELVERLHLDLRLGVARLGALLADRDQPPSPDDIESKCGTATVIADLDALMWPDIQVSALHLLSVLARRRPIIAVWPGDVKGGRAIYSAPGRVDFHDVALRDVGVLRPRTVRFPDEVPFTIERFTP